MLMNTTFLGDSFFIKWQSRGIPQSGRPGQPFCRTIIILVTVPPAEPLSFTENGLENPLAGGLLVGTAKRSLPLSDRPLPA